MKKINLLLSLVVALLFVSQVNAQNTTQQTTPTKGFGQSLGLYVFPAKNQDKKTQDADEASCYKWAQQQTGFDPINPTKVTAQKASTAPNGSMVVGAAGGSAAGAAIGAIAGDAGKGAAIGAVVGGLRGIRARAARNQAEQQQNNQAAAGQEKAMLDSFKKAFSACMEAKGYTVK